MKKILIINRGEIAIRIAKAIRELGHIAVGVWTSNEVNAPHLEYCDEWVKLEGNSNSETYLNIPQILKIINDHKIDAVHPGYGFLSENIEFSKVLKEKKIIFIGPNADAVFKMGDKAISKKLAKAAGVPVVPGSDGEVANKDDAKKIANTIGYPVLLKATAGGGGRGMRICQNESEVDKFFDVVKREALSAFKYDGVLIEKYIVNPHHIEVQIIADKRGNIFHCFERECSIQRRHQKIIEESPSPFIGHDEKLRQNLCETAVKLAKAVNYDSAGTVEFIMGADKNFYFLEMNTRIQVEHPITEEVIGYDLLACMIQSALDLPMDIKAQSDLKQRGHSIECRICAEDPITMIPAPGLVTAVETTFPQGVRFDHCLFNGLNITADFDPMVGKLITTGANREIALRKMRAALNGLLIEGLKNNIPLLKVILDNKIFIEGDYSTNFIEKQTPQKLVNTEINIENIIQKIAQIEIKNLMENI
ncbi:MAG: biotin carboxylase N-terminal domain-containing protein [Bacteriovoracaceae bacterium]